MAASSATRRGLASGSTCTARPTCMRVVRAATALAATSGEASTARCGRKCASPSQRVSRPRSSATCASLNHSWNVWNCDAPSRVLNMVKRPKSIDTSYFPSSPIALGGLEHRQRDLAFALVMPAQLHAHAALDVPGGILHANNIGHNAEALIKVHVGNGVGTQFGKGRMTALHNDGEGVYSSCTLRHTSGEVTRAALRAMAAGIEDHGVACITHLIGQLVPFRSLPERLRVRFRETRLGSWCCHGLVSPHIMVSHC